MAPPARTPNAERYQTFEVRFAEALDLDRREEVVLRLCHQRGVRDAWFDAADATRLLVHADPGRFSAVTLRDFVLGLRLGARIAGDDSLRR